jgi:ABC-2 type transport system permease protein
MTAATLERAHLTFTGVVRSEWIKLVTLRSTMWCYLIMAAVTIGLGFVLAVAGPAAFGNDDSGAIPAETQQAIWLQAATLGIGFTQLVTVVLGALVITGEYGTGMIRSTFAVVPARLPALAAKALVFGLVTFTVGLVSIVATAVLTAPLLPASGIHPDFGDQSVWMGWLGGAGYLTLIGLLAMAIGAIIRVSAGGIAAGLGLVLVLPAVLQVVSRLTGAAWAQSISAILPSAAGGRMYSYPVDTDAPAAPGVGQIADGIVLEPWQGLLVLVTWVAVMFILAATLLKRRDA